MCTIVGLWFETISQESNMTLMPRYKTAADVGKHEDTFSRYHKFQIIMWMEFVYH